MPTTRGGDRRWATATTSGHPASAAGYDYTLFGRHRLRAPHGAVVDLPVPFHTDTTVWVATERSDEVPGRGVVVRCPRRRWVGGRGLGWWPSGRPRRSP